MKFIFLFLVFVSVGFSSVIKSTIISVDLKENIATIKIPKIDVGMSGFITHSLDKDHSVILKNVVVKSFNKETQIATLKMSRYDDLSKSSLPHGRWEVATGDSVTLAFGYSRAILIAPSEEVYYRVTRASKHLQWVHPDIFATILSFNGHPTPLKEDFIKLSKATSVGLVFFYLNEQLFTVDARSFKILNIAPAPLGQDSVVLPFYMRVESIEANWWGDGSDELTEYEPHYFELLIKHNKHNKKLFEIIKSSDAKLQKLLNNFKTEE